MNKLRFEDSLYLKQHANNPVNWYAWKKQSIEKAKKEDLPIILSIGYSACHWCHVMAHESFEDLNTAKIMNSQFFNIKVDREERPDLDSIYQTAHQVLSGESGGWPLTLFLDPNTLVPFFSGTYFPKENKFGKRAFKDVLHIVSKAYEENKIGIDKQIIKIKTLLNEEIYKNYEMQISDKPVKEGILILKNNFDRKYGGFGLAPKFPQFSSLTLINEVSSENESGYSKSKSIVEFTLNRMVHGGLRDHLKGGFFRYSIDQQWMIPHFEKMLYDNSQLISLLVDTWIQNKEKLFLDIAIETGNWILEDMQSNEGGFYSTVDADSEGEEGKYYVWELQELEKILEPKEKELFYDIFNLKIQPNFEGKYHLYCKESLDFYSKKYNKNYDEFINDLNKIKYKLLSKRDKRTPPSKDQKILVSWNALTIEGLSKLYSVTGEIIYLEAAEKALRFIKDKCWIQDLLFSTYNNKSAKFGPYLNDYAFLAKAIFFFLQQRWSDEYVDFGLQILDKIRELFIEEDGKTYMTSKQNSNELVYRPKHLFDESIPSGNAIASLAFNLFGHLMGNKEYIEIANNIVRDAFYHVEKHPEAMSSMLIALHNLSLPPNLNIIFGNKEKVTNWTQSLRKENKKNNFTFGIPSSSKIKPEYLKEIKVQSDVFGIVCNDISCSKPFKDLKELMNFKRNN